MLTIDIFQIKKGSKVHAIDPASGRAFCAKNIKPVNPHMRETVEASTPDVNCMCCSSYLEEYQVHAEANNLADEMLNDLNKMYVPAVLARTKVLLQEIKESLATIEKVHNHLLNK